MTAPAARDLVELVDRIATFLRGVGLEVRIGAFDGDSFLPGLRIDEGVLLVDPDQLRYPGDMLHEAGHIAVTPPEARTRLAEITPDGGDEMAAIAWSYAACLHLGLAPELLFHEGGYRGGGHALLENFAAGRYIGVPLLQWFGMAVERQTAAPGGPAPYPHMLRWLR